MTREELCEFGLESAIVFDSPDFDSAIIGFDMVTDRVVYDYERMIEHLMETDGMTYEDAIEFIDCNTVRAYPYMGAAAPIIVRII
jgi:hypothetical protein